MRAVLLAGGLLLAAAAQAQVVEEQLRLPVQVPNSFERVFEREIVVTLWREVGGARPYAAMVLNHGRATQAEKRVAMGRARFSEISDWFARQGFIVAVPTRLGYGVTGGEDVEDSGSCGR